jgi:hypothetical protein
MYHQVFNHRYRKFTNNVSEKTKQTKNIATYFDLSFKEKEHMSITLEKHPQNPENSIILSLKFSKKNPMENITNLPVELLQKIYSYVSHEYIHLSFMITFTDEYPFVPPIWSLMDEKNNVSSSMLYLNDTTFRDYFQQLTLNHNERYQPNLESIQSEHSEYSLADMSENQRRRILNHYHWSPAITIEKDVLCFLTRINHFEYLV